MKKILIGIRASIKLIALFVICSIVIVAIIMSVYKPIYSVTFKGEMLGYSENRAALQARIEKFLKKGNGEDSAFGQLDETPEYKLCFLKKGIETNDEEIYSKIVGTGSTYYNFYAVLVDNEEKLYVKTFEEAESVVNKLVEKDSKNAKQLSIVPKYEKEKQEFTSVEVAVTNLYENKITPDIAKNMGRVTRAGNRRKHI